MIGRWRIRTTPDLEAARRSRAQAQVNLEKTRAATLSYEQFAERFRDMRQENHFGEAISNALRERK